MASWTLEIVPSIVTVPHEKFGTIDVHHAYSNVMYSSPQIKTRTGSVEICQLPDAFDVLHKYPHTDDLGPQRVEEIRLLLCEMTGRELTWIESVQPSRLVPVETVKEVEPEAIVKLDAVDAPDA